MPKCRGTLGIVTWDFKKLEKCGIRHGSFSQALSTHGNNTCYLFQLLSEVSSALEDSHQALRSCRALITMSLEVRVTVDFKQLTHSVTPRSPRCRESSKRLSLSLVLIAKDSGEEAQPTLGNPVCLDSPNSGSSSRRPTALTGQTTPPVSNHREVEQKVVYDSSTGKKRKHAGMEGLGSLLRLCYSGAPHARGPACRSARLAVLRELVSFLHPSSPAGTPAHLHAASSTPPLPHCCVSRFRDPLRPQAGRWRGCLVCGVPAKGSRPPCRPILPPRLPTAGCHASLSRLPWY